MSAIQLQSAAAPGAMPLRSGSQLSIVACVGKGGAGKSTVATNLAVMACLSGRRSAIIDADPQASSYAWKCVRANGDVPVVRCVVEALADAIEAARRAGIEILFVDMPPDWRHVPNVARLADLVLVTMRPTLFDLKVTRMLVPILNSANSSFAVILNAAPPLRELGEPPMVRQAREALADIGSRLWRRQITHRVTVPYATVRGATVVETEPEGLAAQEFGSLWNAVRNDLKLEGPIHEVA
ncbi:AAA family ATPase [Bradyrhizobium sp. JYMT SZCCT0180]|uniref:nucleotide-binding protein n=1 Tax=Bradyrhizobium sp. JYMT SZCCT0180 TaxID=2807666 RepID=UPI001BA7E26F|nr:AAA family ATPase [Bradyrhizobium sp. JYMT SZCCT0180]MBR1214590.1 AAA family ATPase [Bradyrhizobium sp. JYMT SZCCT0180]